MFFAFKIQHSAFSIAVVLPAQKLLIAVAVLIGLAMIIYPPWTEFYFLPEGGAGRTYHGYHFLWDKPSNTPGVQPKGPGVRIHSGRLSAQLMVVAISSFVVYVVLGARGRKQPPRSLEREPGNGD